MSKEGLPEVIGDAVGKHICIITSTWNEEICDQLHKRAVDTAQKWGAYVDEVRVVGALELPVVAQAAARKYDAVVALGCVVRGGTPHFDYVCDSVTQGLTRVALDESTPVGNGVLTVENQDQAVNRAGFEHSVEDKGAEAVAAALDTANKLATLDELASARGL